jgi:hypothetical protein
MAERRTLVSAVLNLDHAPCLLEMRHIEHFFVQPDLSPPSQARETRGAAGKRVFRMNISAGVSVATAIIRMKPAFTLSPA